ncbi:hypothetical protein ACRTEV_12855 [Rossellomorea arthrocnemi]
MKIEQTIWVEDTLVDEIVFRQPGDWRIYLWIRLQAGTNGELMWRNGKMIYELREPTWFYNGKKKDNYSPDWIKKCLKRLEKRGLIRLVENGLVVPYGDGEGPRFE